MDFVDWFPYLVAIGLTSVPAYFGASFGYRNAELLGQTPSTGAFQGASSAVKWVFGTVVVLLVLASFAACVLSFAFVLIGVVVGLLGLVCVLFAAYSAGLASMVVARNHGPRAAGLAAALAAPLGILLALALLAGNDSRRHRRFGLETPRPVISASVPPAERLWPGCSNAG